jgi:H2-forming N5,N10-methylenetetrahydromethanopterin dehydrogenase-like enzyme
MAGSLGTSETDLNAPAIVRNSCSCSPIVLSKTLAADSTKRVKGTVLGVISAGGNFAPYVDTNQDGTQTARAILMEDVAAHAGATYTALVAMQGQFIEANLTGIDANGKTDLEAVGIYME